jgi:hypothetical protein
MSRTMMKWTMAGALALAAVGVVGAGTAQAKGAPATASPFAGSYYGDVPGYPFSWPRIDISASGRIDGDWSTSATTYGLMDGSVSAAGSMRCRGSYSFHEDWYSLSGSIRFNASVTKGSDGVLHGTTDTGATFTWYPK